MNSNLTRRSLLALGSAAAITPAAAQHALRAFSAGDIVISQAWTRATPPGAKAAAGFMVIENRGGQPDRLIGGSFAGAASVEIHEMAMSGGVMHMRELAQGIVIPPGGKIELKPGGLHVMFIGLSGAVAQGAAVKGELIFEKAGKVAVEYFAAPVGARGPGHGIHQ